MRTLMMLAAACFVCQAGFATPQELLVVKLSKPDMDQAVFVADRNACLTKANSEHWDWALDAGTWARHHLKVFGECMGARGYKSDPNGIKAIRYLEQREGGRGKVFVEAL